MNIYIRVSENQKTISGVDRWNSYDKRMTLKKCWMSLMINVTSEDFITIYHHDVRDETLNWLSNKCSTLHNFVKINSLEESFLVPLEDMKANLKAEKDKNKLYALLEDDYLWNGNALRTIKDATKHWKGFIAPNDTPANYKDFTQAHILLGQDRHWRTTNYISWNLIGTQEIFSTFIDDIITSGTDIKELNNILNKTKCINPLPGVATHCKQEDMTPLVNWDYVWDGIKL